jgi:hypothetical protein
MNEYHKHLEGNELYNQLLGRWRYLYHSFMGGEVYKRHGYLTRYATETDLEYQERINNTPLDNHCKGVINIYNAFLFRNDVDRDFGSLVLDPSLEPFLQDADLEGRSLNAFMKDVSTYSSIFGHCWLLMVKPQTNARTRAEELAQEIRPYVNILTPLSVLDWRWERAPNGVYYLSYLKYIEDSDFANITVVREWTEIDIITTTLDDESQTVASKTVELNGIGRIPAICVYNQRSPQRGVGLSDIEDIADQQRGIYNEYSEVESSIRLNGHPSLVKTADTEASAGAGSIVQIPDSLDPGLKPYMLEVSNDVGAIYNSIQNKVDSIDRMANTAAVRAKSTRVLSGVAMEVEFSMLNARLSEKADNLELAEEQMWRLFAQYQGRVWDGEIEYPDSFSIHDKDNDYMRLQMAKGAATDPVVFKAIDGSLLELMGYEKEDLPYTDPVSQPGRLYPEGDVIPETLPAAYQSAANPEVPQGQACGNCEYFKATDSYCTKFDAIVRPDYWCAKWDIDLD